MSNLLCWSLRFFCLFAGIALISAGAAWAQEHNGKVLVTACLISDVNSIQAGQKFRIGVLYRIEPGWHIYWKYALHGVERCFYPATAAESVAPGEVPMTWTIQPRLRQRRAARMVCSIILP